MNLPSPLCVGIDVSKATLDTAASSTISQFSVASDSNGFDSIIAELKKHAVALVLMEATGGLEAAVACALQAEGFEIAVHNPRQGRGFARALNCLVQMAGVINRAIQKEVALSRFCRMQSVRFLMPW